MTLSYRLEVRKGNYYRTVIKGRKAVKPVTADYCYLLKFSTKLCRTKTTIDSELNDSPVLMLTMSASPTCHGC